jgi:hypothetical protein
VIAVVDHCIAKLPHPPKIWQILRTPRPRLLDKASEERLHVLSVYSEFSRTPPLQGIAKSKDCPDDRPA